MGCLVAVAFRLLCASMKALPKRKGNLTVRHVRVEVKQSLNESPSEKEGK